jgi:hypothetical protein
MLTAFLDEELQAAHPAADRPFTPWITPRVNKHKTGVWTIIGDALLMDREEMADVIGDEHTAHLRCALQHRGVIGPEELGVVALNSLHVTATTTKLDRYGWVQHLIEQ